MEASDKGVPIVAFSTMRRQFLQFFYTAATENNVVRLQSFGEPRDDIQDVLAPLFLSSLLQTAEPDVVLIGGFFVGQMAEFHGFHYAVHHQGRSQTGAQTKKKHF